MEKKMTFNYFYGTEADLFSFYRIPKALFTDSYFKDLSSDAKILYGLMLDRMSLSIKNQWFDDKNRAYIYFSIEDIMELLNCGRNKAIKSMRELDDETGIGLIEKRRQGFGKVNVIYVKTFMPEKTDEKRFDSDNRSEDYQAYENLVKETIDYESLEVTHHDDMRQVDEIVNLIVETVMCKNDKILIASDWYPASLVKKKFLMLTYSHIEYAWMRNVNLEENELTITAIFQQHTKEETIQTLKEALEVLEQEESDPENDEIIEIINSTVGKLQQIEDKYYYSLDLNYYLNNLEDDAYEA